MTFDFDHEIDRRGTDCLKYDFAEERGYGADVLPLWIADMDFQAPPCVRQALAQAVAHGIFGYSDTKGDYAAAVRDWFAQHFDWRMEEKWIVKTPGVVFALAMAVRASTRAGDAVMIQPPVYYPFYSVIRDNGREVVENELVCENGRYRIDFEDFERKITERGVKLLILCSPHNPVGRVWTQEELRRMGEICRRYGVRVVSDEIHCDFAFPEFPHTPFVKANPAWAEQTVVCTAPSKSFNLAGLQVSNIIIPGAEFRREFIREIRRAGYSQLNQLGLLACRAAYRGGGPWLEEVKAYMRGNLEFLREFLAARLPQVRLVEPEGTYFAWLDFSALGLSGQALDDLIKRKARLWLDAGHVFGGADSWKFQRLVLACPRATLERALKRLEEAVATPD